ncbi:MAG: arsenate reductase (glutaredoxin) [Pseudomonadota bacterium]|nr:arsenate reductase (glutaredoxin) [Pseudomonadota bacterium]
MDITIYHNPRCSKSRQTLALIQEAGIEPNIVEYLKNPPSEKTLSHLLDLLKMEPRELMRRQEAEYREAGLDDTSLDRESLIRAMHEHPKLIERPIVVAGNRAVIGRPPENVLELLSDG